MRHAATGKRTGTAPGTRSPTFNTIIMSTSLRSPVRSDSSPAHRTPVELWTYIFKCVVNKPSTVNGASPYPLCDSDRDSMDHESAANVAGTCTTFYDIIIPIIGDHLTIRHLEHLFFAKRLYRSNPRGAQRTIRATNLKLLPLHPMLPRLIPHSLIDYMANITHLTISKPWQYQRTQPRFPTFITTFAQNIGPHVEEIKLVRDQEAWWLEDITAVLRAFPRTRRLSISEMECAKLTDNDDDISSTATGPQGTTTNTGNVDSANSAGGNEGMVQRGDPVFNSLEWLSLGNMEHENVERGAEREGFIALLKSLTERSAQYPTLQRLDILQDAGELQDVLFKYNGRLKTLTTSMTVLNRGVTAERISSCSKLTALNVTVDCVPSPFALKFPRLAMVHIFLPKTLRYGARPSKEHPTLAYDTI